MKLCHANINIILYKKRNYVIYNVTYIFLHLTANKMLPFFLKVMTSKNIYYFDFYLYFILHYSQCSAYLNIIIINFYT